MYTPEENEHRKDTKKKQLRDSSFFQNAALQTRPFKVYVILGLISCFLLFSSFLIISREIIPNLANSSKSYEIFGYKQATTSVFWVGEGATDANGHIHNFSSAWDETWLESYGGVDAPDRRCGIFPCAFVPKQNPFYFALPYDDLIAQTGVRKESSKQIPWYDEETAEDYETILENHWIKVVHGNRTCYAQWKDVGPFQSDDFDYVFGENPRPENTQGLGAGLDVSPATRDCLGFIGSAQTHWKFVSPVDVPPGPWKVVVNGT